MYHYELGVSAAKARVEALRDLGEAIDQVRESQVVNDSVESLRPYRRC